ncbi:hypothetical protein KAW38_00810 [Candidatus Micrarchaeota archaeon]|nr:hypothetical protein [Candidatus Micrarchaeota archaeon]
MAFNFKAFTKKVLSLLKGKISPDEITILSHLFNKTSKKNRILATGILSVLKVGGATKDDIMKFSTILDEANNRIMQEKLPFTKKAEKELAKIFSKTKFPQKARRTFKHDLDIPLTSAINENIRRKKRVPRKKFSK